MEFLTASNFFWVIKLKILIMDTLNCEGKNVVVIGGGDTAMDCVRTAISPISIAVMFIQKR